MEIVDLIEDGDRLAARLVFQLNHQGEYLGVPATGNDAVFTITTLFRFRDGRVSERSSTADMLGLLIQLGAIPPPGAELHPEHRIRSLLTL